jgi:hypothetical protein
MLPVPNADRNARDAQAGTGTHIALGRQSAHVNRAPACSEESAVRGGGRSLGRGQDVPGFSIESAVRLGADLPGRLVSREPGDAP